MRIRRALPALLIVLPAGALASEMHSDSEGAPWRRAVARVKYEPAVEAWADAMQRERNVVQYVLMLDEPKYVEKRCYWPVEIRSEGKVWKRFLVTPDGKGMIEDKTR